MSLLGSKHHPSSGGDHGELWVVSYADMMTLLFGFFVILYSFSQMDEKKYSVVSKQLAEAFGGEVSGAKSESEVGMMMQGKDLRALQLLVAMLNLGDSIDKAERNLEKDISDAKNLESARDMILKRTKNDTALASLGISTESKQDRIEIALPDSVLFEPGTAELTPKAKDALKRIAGYLARMKGLVGVEIVGHTDSSPPGASARFPSNWSLSSARAGAVAEALIHEGLDRKGLFTRGMADLEPLFPEKRADGTALPDNMAKNRRVAIVVKRVARDN